jgi:hypothetical protein
LGGRSDVLDDDNGSHPYPKTSSNSDTNEMEALRLPMCRYESSGKVVGREESWKSPEGFRLPSRINLFSRSIRQDDEGKG